jgi:hypothetical protein
MPDYLVTDPATGQRIKMTGPAPPSEALIRLALAKVQPLPSHVQQTQDPLQAMQKAQTIGPARVGERYQDDLNPSLVGIARKVLGGAQRPPSVAAEDPYGIGAWLKGAGPMPTPIAAEIQAFHGSPHDFEKFLLEKIGTGEGAQAYGHGLYFAENEAVAKDYRNSLSAGKFEYQGQPVDPRTSLGRTLDFLRDSVRNGENLEEALPKRIQELRSHAEFMRKAEPNYGSDAMYDRAADQLAQLDPKKLKMGGKMYEVSIKADPDQFLDWDKPLSQQSEAVQQAVAQAKQKALGDVRPAKLKDGSYGLARINSDGSGNIIPGISEKTPEDALAALQKEQGHGSGQWAYDMLSRTIRKPGAFPELSIPDKAAAAQSLREAGIPGIKYLDQGSRAQPYRGDSAPLHAAKSFLDAGHSADDALAGLKATYKNTSPTELQQAVNEVYGTTQGTHNYVVFDDKLIDILKKYAVAGAVGGSLASLGQPPAEEQK